MRNANTKIIKNYIGQGLNIMLIGPHGTGKTSVLRQAAKELGWTVADYSAPLMEPYIHLLGVPEVVEDEDGRYLEMVRTRSLMDAEVIFIDELNRGPLVVRNGVMELINDRSINGVKLPNLKCVVSACNPAGDGDYAVQLLDPAQMDRFDVTLTMSEKVDAKYLAKSLGDEVYAKAFSDWQHSLVFWSEDERGKRVARAPYVSPRRVEKLARVFRANPQRTTLTDVLGSNSEELSLAKLYRTARLALDGSETEDVPAPEVETLLSAGDNAGEVIDNLIPDILANKKFVDELRAAAKSDAAGVKRVIGHLSYHLSETSMTIPLSNLFMDVSALMEELEQAEKAK